MFTDPSGLAAKDPDELEFEIAALCLKIRDHMDDALKSHIDLHRKGMYDFAWVELDLYLKLKEHYKKLNCEDLIGPAPQRFLPYPGMIQLPMFELPTDLRLDEVTPEVVPTQKYLPSRTRLEGR
jgi:hypothetical protein